MRGRIRGRVHEKGRREKTGTIKVRTRLGKMSIFFPFKETLFTQTMNVPALRTKEIQ